jgi:hypothetical protein
MQIGELHHIVIRDNQMSNSGTHQCQTHIGAETSHPRNSDARTPQALLCGVTVALGKNGIKVIRSMGSRSGDKNDPVSILYRSCVRAGDTIDQGKGAVTPALSAQAGDICPWIGRISKVVDGDMHLRLSL